MYRHWNKTFYENAGKEKQLVFYAQEFDTVELNYSFYRMPGLKAFAGWYSITPDHFSFAVKLNRFITHLKRLIIDEESEAALQQFLYDTQGLKEKLSVILIQLQPNQSADLNRLTTFLDYYTSIVNTLQYKPATCIEFRNTTWFNAEVYQTLRQFNISLVFPSTIAFKKLVFTSDFCFIRLHGYKNYTQEELDTLKKEIDDYPEFIRTVWVYFNNDWNTWAIYNARYLKSII